MSMSAIELNHYQSAEVPSERPHESKRLHCKECNWILPGIYNWEWEPNDEERRVVYWTDCWRCGTRNVL